MRRFHSGSDGLTTSAAPAAERQLVGLRVDVDPDDDAPGRPGDAGAQLADQPEAVHGDRLAELQISAPQRLHGDATDRDERRVTEVDAVGDRAPRG